MSPGAFELGVMPPPHHGLLASPDGISAYARAAEAAGFESIWVFEHMVIPAGSARRRMVPDRSAPRRLRGPS